MDERAADRSSTLRRVVRDVPELEQLAEEVRQAAFDALGEQAFAAAWADGERFALQEVVAEVPAPLAPPSE